MLESQGFPWSTIQFFRHPRQVPLYAVHGDCSCGARLNFDGELTDEQGRVTLPVQELRAMVGTPVVFRNNGYAKRG